jgi:DNA-binding MarR family transcriptional regulator
MTAPGRAVRTEHTELPDSGGESTAAGIPADRLAVIGLLEARMAAVAGRTRAGLRDAARAVHPDLQPFAIVLLRQLEQHGPMPPGALATQLDVDKSVISRQTRHLERLGLAEVSIDPADRRNRVIALTPAGAGRLREVGPGGTIRVHSRLHAWDTADLVLFAGYLGRLLDDADDSHDPGERQAGHMNREEK